MLLVNSIITEIKTVKQYELVKLLSLKFSSLCSIQNERVTGIQMVHSQGRITISKTNTLELLNQSCVG